jgi:integrase
MARPTKGSITTHVGKDGLTYRYLRFMAYGERRNVPLGPVSAADAERELRHTIADVERGTWTPKKVQAPPPDASVVPTFREFATEWWKRRSGELAAKTREDYDWRLAVHLLPYFGEIALDRLKVAQVEDYISAKLSEDDPLSPRSINMTVTLLGAVLESALDREIISGRNPARGRKLKEPAPRRSQLDAAGQIVALLDAAGELDRNAQEQGRHVERRAMIATLTFAGLRIGELCSLRWRDVDLAGGWLHTGSKTDAGVRKVKIRGALRDELLTVRQKRPDAPQESYVFGTSSGGRLSADNFRSRVLRAAVKLAGERLEADGLPPLPGKLTPHSLRRTFASALYALGETPPTVMAEMGHTDPGLALKVYAQAMRRGEDETAALRQLIEGGVLANSGKRDEIAAVPQADAAAV